MFEHKDMSKPWEQLGMVYTQINKLLKMIKESNPYKYEERKNSMLKERKEFWHLNLISDSKQDLFSMKNVIRTTVIKSDQI